MDQRTSAPPCFGAMCFGKLPTFADFVRHNAGGRDVVAFDQWLQQGLYHARSRLGDQWERSFGASPSYYFLFFPENSESFLLGLLRPSHDRSMRQYPFVVSLRVDRRFPGDLLRFAPVVFAPFLERAARLVSDIQGATTLHDIAVATDQLSTPVDVDYRELVRSHAARLGSTPVGSLCSAVWRRADDPRCFLVFKNLLDTLVPLRGRNIGRRAPGLRFPIAGDDGTIASFWLDAVVRALNTAAVRPFVFWRAPDDVPTPDRDGADQAKPAAKTAHLFLFLRQPSAESLLYFMRTDLNTDFICEADVDCGGRMAAARASLPSNLGAVLSDGGATLSDVLDAVGSRTTGAEYWLAGALAHGGLVR